MTLQEIFNKVKSHLLTQKVRAQTEDKLSVYGGYFCAYRGDNGTKCAVGCLIADEHYRPECEWASVYTGRVQRALIASGVPIGADPRTINLLSRLQAVHDLKSPEEWDTALTEVAQQYGLETGQ